MWQRTICTAWKRATRILLVAGIMIMTGCVTTGGGGGGKVRGSTGNTAEGTADVSNIDELLQYNRIVSSGKIRVGLLLPLSGNFEKIGENFLNAAQMAIVSSKNSKLVLLPFDTKGSVFGAIEAANNAVNRQVNVIIGPFSGAETKAVAKIAMDNGITVISLASEQSLTKQGVFVAGFTPQQEVEKIVSYAVSEGMNNFSAVLPTTQEGYAYSSILKDVVNRKDGKVVRVEFYREDEKSIKRTLQTVADAYAINDAVFEAYENEDSPNAVIDETTGKPKFIVKEEDKIYADAIFIPEGGTRLNLLTSLLKGYSTGKHEYRILGSTKWDASFDTLNKYFLQDEWFPAPEPKIFGEFELDYYDVYGEYPIRWASIVYDLIKTFNFIAKDKGVEGLTKEGLAKYSGFTGIDGSFRFLPDGTVERRFAVLTVDGERRKVVGSPLSRFFD